jgi:hypothetical protein
MATSKTTTPRSSTAAKRSASGPTHQASTNAKSHKSDGSATKTDPSIVARATKTIQERPLTSAAIATGAVAAAAAGAYLLTRKDKSFKEASGDLAATVKDGLSSAGGKVKDLAERGSDYVKGAVSSDASGQRTQAEIAKDALALKQSGATESPVDQLSAIEIKTGAISY